jgi:hypothetical protein
VTENDQNPVDIWRAMPKLDSSNTIWRDVESVPPATWTQWVRPQQASRRRSPRRGRFGPDEWASLLGRLCSEAEAGGSGRRLRLEVAWPAQPAAA